MDNVLTGSLQDNYCQQCKGRKARLFDVVAGRVKVTLGTLGPDGTTSSETARAFRDYFLRNVRGVEFMTRFFDTFELALEALKHRELEYILLPNAYGKMTNFYWDRELELVHCFMNETPRYGIATLKPPSKDPNQIYRLVTCKPVAHLALALWNTTDYREFEFEVLEESSTKKSLISMEMGGGDFAITNDSSLRGSDAFFISDTVQADVLWSIFVLKG